MIRPLHQRSRLARKQIRMHMLDSVCTSRTARKLEDGRKIELRRNFSDAMGAALEHADSGRALSESDLRKWHSIIMRGEEKAGVIRSDRIARCGKRYFVPGSQVKAKLSEFFGGLNVEMRDATPVDDM